MMKNAVIFMLLLAVAGRSFAQKIEPSAASFDLNSCRDSIKIPIVLKADAATLKSAQFLGKHPTVVQLGDRSDEQFCNAITFEFNRTTATLTIGVKLGSLDLPGTYDIDIEYITGKPQVPQHLKFKLVRAAATLESLNTVTITKVGAQISIEGVVLVETGKKTGVRNLNASVYLSNTQAFKLISFKPADCLVAAGNRGTVYYTIDTAVLNAVPLGKNEGKLLINSNSLSAPLTVTLVVVRKLWSGWIVVTVLLGLVLSYLIKQVLTRNKSNEAIRLSAYQLMQDISNFSDSLSAGAYETKLEDCLANMRDVIDDTYQNPDLNADQARSNIQAQNTAFLQIKRDFATDYNTQKQLFNSLKDALYGPGLLPLIVWYLENARQILIPVFDFLNDPKKKYDDAVTELGKIPEAAVTALENYKDYAIAVLLLLQEEQQFPKNTSDTFVAIKQSAAALSADLDAWTLDPLSLAATINKANSLQKRIEGIPVVIAAALQQEWKDVYEHMNDTREIAAAIDQWRAAIADLTSNKSRASDTVNYPVKQLALKINKSLDDAVEKPAVDAVEASELSTSNPRDNNAAATIASTPDFKFNTVLRKPSNLNLLLSQASHKYWKYNLLQTGVAGLLISLGAYGSLQATFVGTPSEFIGIFLLAFSMDIAVASVAQFKAKL